MDRDLVHAMVRAIEIKDLSTAAHTWRVVLYTRAMAEEAGFDKELTERLGTAAALHDLGKLDIPDAILQKPEKLTAEEYEVIKTHPVRGHQRLVAMDERDPFLLDLVRSHHERWDGSGYPDNLAGEAIPIAARYFAVIDAFDAMTSLRPYRHQVGESAAERAIQELRAGQGTRYWPQAVQLFAALLGAGRLKWITEYFNDACPVNYEHDHDLPTLKARPSPGAPRPDQGEPGSRSDGSASPDQGMQNGHRP